MRVEDARRVEFQILRPVEALSLVADGEAQRVRQAFEAHLDMAFTVFRQGEPAVQFLLPAVFQQ